MSEPRTLHEGTLKKKSPKMMMGFINVWQDRYFVLEHNKMLYYKDAAARKSSSPKGWLLHINCVVDSIRQCLQA